MRYENLKKIQRIFKKIHGGAPDVSTRVDNRLFRISQRQKLHFLTFKEFFRRHCLNFAINSSRDGLSEENNWLVFRLIGLCGLLILY